MTTVDQDRFVARLLDDLEQAEYQIDAEFGVDGVDDYERTQVRMQELRAEWSAMSTPP